MLDELLPAETEDTREKLVKVQGECYRRRLLRRAPAFPGVRDLFEGLEKAGVLLESQRPVRRKNWLGTMNRWAFSI